jgi:hypothetical protein
MSIQPLPILEPLVKDLQDLHIGYYLKTNRFKKFMVKHGWHEIWNSVYNEAKKSRNYFSVDLDHEPFDCQDGLTILFNSAYNRNRDLFYEIVFEVIKQFGDWDEKEIQLPYDTLIEDFELIGFPQDFIEALGQIRNKKTQGVPVSVMPEGLWNAAKLETSLTKMDEAIKTGDYNLTLTYAYSCLEGLFKAFIQTKIPSKITVDKLNQQAAIVRDYLKAELDSKGNSYPEGMLNLIPTITNSISNARNGYSASHFDNNADQWLAEFSRDCVNSIARLILKFIDK